MKNIHLSNPIFCCDITGVWNRDWWEQGCVNVTLTHLSIQCTLPSPFPEVIIKLCIVCSFAQTQTYGVLFIWNKPSFINLGLGLGLGSELAHFIKLDQVCTCFYSLKLLILNGSEGNVPDSKKKPAWYSCTYLHDLETRRSPLTKCSLLVSLLFLVSRSDAL